MEVTNDFMIVHGRGLQTSIAILSHFEVTLLPSKQRAFSDCLDCSLLLKEPVRYDRLNLYLNSNVSDKFKGSAAALFQEFQWYPIN